MPMPKHRLEKNLTELVSAEKRAELEVLISKIDNSFEEFGQVLTAVVTYFIYHLFKEILPEYIEQGLDHPKLRSNHFVKASKINPLIFLFILSVFISGLNYYLGPFIHNAIKKGYRSLIRWLKVFNLKYAVSIAENPDAKLSLIENYLSDFQTQDKIYVKLRYIMLIVPLVIFAQQVAVILHFLLCLLLLDAKTILSQSRSFILEQVFLATISAPVWMEMYKSHNIRRQQTSLQLYHYDLFINLTKDFKDITFKKQANSNLGYLAILFKISDFKKIQTLKIEGTAYDLSYKDVFDGILYCIGLVKSAKVSKMDKFSIVVSADVTGDVIYDSDHLRKKLFIFLQHKNNNLFLKEKLLEPLNKATSFVQCDWQAVEKKENGLPKLLFIADVAALDKKKCETLHHAIQQIYNERVKLENDEIIIEPIREDVHSGYLAHYRDLKDLIEGRIPAKQSSKSSPTLFSPDIYSGGILGNRNPSKPVQPGAIASTFIPTKTENSKSFTIKWSNGITYDHETEQAKADDDDTRVIPLSCGRNNEILHKRFLVIDPKLKDEINDENLYKRYVGCFWKSIASKSNEQGRKRLMTDYRDCEGKQQISQWEVKIPRTDPRAYVRVLDVQSDPPGFVLCLADGYNPHPHKK